MVDLDSKVNQCIWIILLCFCCSLLPTKKTDMKDLTRCTSWHQPLNLQFQDYKTATLTSVLQQPWNHKHCNFLPFFYRQVVMHCIIWSSQCMYENNVWSAKQGVKERKCEHGWENHLTGPAVTDSDPDQVRPHEGLPCSWSALCWCFTWLCYLPFLCSSFFFVLFFCSY